MSKFGDRMKMFRQAESLAMDRDRVKRRSLAYSAFAEGVSPTRTVLATANQIRYAIPLSLEPDRLY